MSAVETELAARANGGGPAVPRPLLVASARAALADRRRALAKGSPVEVALDDVARETLARADAFLGDRLRPVLNATGVPLHTNLGRAPLAPDVVRAVAEAAVGYGDLEIDLASGRRVDRLRRIRALLRLVFRVEDGLAVNNNAAAITLVLNTLAGGREVVVSRGELVEIGGSFRLPEVIRAAGVRLREVGTTNRTRAADYEEAIGPSTGALLKVHRSNFAITGYVQEAGLPELADLGRRFGVPVIHDLGSGAPDASLDEPAVADHLDAGASLVCLSADKGFGGPQAGLALGESDLVERALQNPLARAFRLGKLSVAALEAALHSTLLGADVPVREMMVLPADEIGARAERVAAAIRAGAPALSVDVVDGVSEAGGGAHPGVELPTRLLRLSPTSETPGVEALARALRRGPTPVLGVLRDGALLLDLRTVSPEDDRRLAEACSAAVGLLLEGER